MKNKTIIGKIAVIFGTFFFQGFLGKKQICSECYGKYENE